MIKVEIVVGNKDDMLCKDPSTTIEKTKKEKLRQANIKEACDKFKGMSSSLYCLILVPSKTCHSTL